MNVNAVEALWLGANVVAAIVTSLNLLDAWRNWRAFDDDGLAQRVLAWAHVRRELLQLLVVVALVVVVLPALGRPGDTPLNPTIVAIMLVPIGIALNSVLDRRTRRTLSRLIEAEE